MHLFSTKLGLGIPARIVLLLACLLTLCFARARGQTSAEYVIVGIAADDTLNVRSGPGSNFRVVATLKNGATGITIDGARVMNGSDDWIHITFPGGTGWTRPKYLARSEGAASLVNSSQPRGLVSQEQDSDSRSSPQFSIQNTTRSNGSSTHHKHVRRILTDIQNKLIPLAGLLIDDTILEDLRALCPASTPAQRGSVRRALLLIIDDDFLAEIREQGGPAVMAPHVKASAIRMDPSISETPCLLDAIDEIVHELLTNPLNN